MILLEKTEEIKDQIKPPRNPQNRIIAQKSLFVRPPKGFVEPEHYKVIDIPGFLKAPMLDHLQTQHGISTQTVYNDLHGFIRDQGAHLKECIEVYGVEMLSGEDVFRTSLSQPRNDKET